jgi:multisite-specific tRNA:(cytosine-C5)-methyltransferase
LAIIPDAENTEFWAAMRRDLPASFRFAGSKGFVDCSVLAKLTMTSHALAVQQKLIDYFVPKISSMEFEGQKVEPPKPVPWFPSNLAWVMNSTKQVIRKFPPFAEFQKFLVSETGVGNISRQEIVSMIPPLVMDLRPGMTVLDMCAAPGSKSAQLIELIHDGEESRIRRHNKDRGQNGHLEAFTKEADGDWSDDGRATGLLIANDGDQRRAQLLVHQTKRLNSPNTIVTNHDASNFPSIQLPSRNNRSTFLKFDRILADVPCSGDGTSRKNPSVWKDWVPGNGLGLHNLQYRILVRALQMLKVGGRVVYSTCSMNPIEDEAVIATAIEQCGGLAHVRLLDCGSEIPGLKRAAGLNTWKVMDKRYKFWNSWSEVEAALEADAWTDPIERDVVTRLSETMFPPQTTNEDTRIPLERCMRVYPHLQDTGGFFIAVMEKVADIRPKQNTAQGAIKASKAVVVDVAMENNTVVNSLPGAAEKTENGASTPASEVSQSGVKRAAEEDIDTLSKKAKMDSSIDPPKEPVTAQQTVLDQVRGPDPNRNIMNPNKLRTSQSQEEWFKYLDGDCDALQQIFSFYQVSPDFPKDRFMVRNETGEPVRAIYYTSGLVRDILTQNEGKGIRFVNAGIKMFVKQDVQGQDACPWRIQTDGLNLIEPWIDGTRVIRLNKKETLRKLLIEMFIKVSGEDYKQLGEISEPIRDLPMGCAILIVESNPEDPEGFTYVEFAAEEYANNW